MEWKIFKLGYEDKSLAKRLTMMMMTMRMNVMMTWDLNNHTISNKHYVPPNSQHGKENTFIKFLIEQKVLGQVVVHKLDGEQVLENHNQHHQ